MQAVLNAVTNKKDCFSREFCEEWSGDVLGRIIVDFGVKSIEGGLAMDAFGYITGIRDCNMHISEYRTIYDYMEECFENSVLDFFNDQVVWSSIIGYLDESVNIYTIILTDERVKKMRQKLLATYDKVARGNIMSMAQEIEDFLAGFECEKERHNNPGDGGSNEL